MNRKSTRLWAMPALLVGMACGFSSCKPDAPDEILLAYSGDCQAYIEPCG